MDKTLAPSGDYQQAIARGWLPIREVSRQTGVNPVTLRAWERRYGLVVPHRTPKGHRLYSTEQVARIQDILTWLNRGVSVSQVKALLETRQPGEGNIDSDWNELHQAMREAIGALAERRLDDQFDRAMKLYPPRTCCEQLLMPLLAVLEQHWQGQFGAQLEQVFFHSWLRSKLGARVYHSNRQQSGAPLLMVNLSAQPMEPGLWLSAWLASSADCPVEVLDRAPPFGELGLAVERIAPRLLLLYSSQALASDLLRRHLPRLLERCPVPLLLAGPAVHIHEEELQRLRGLLLAADPLGAQQVLHEQGLLAPG
jgi:DNA-binding transcriptional MerR regulator